MSMIKFCDSENKLLTKPDKCLPFLVDYQQGSHSHGKAWNKILSWKMDRKNKVMEIKKYPGKVMEFLYC